jgi:hypothetical protein
MKTLELKWTKGRVIAAIGAACFASMLSSAVSELTTWNEVSAKIDRMRKVIGWYSNFANSSPERSRDYNVWNDEGAGFPREFAQGKAIIARNRGLGLDAWSGLDGFQQELLLGCPPISLWCLHYNRCYNVYFDRNRTGIIISSRSTPLSEISPELQSLARKFHLKESKHAAGIYGLDTAYYHERIQTSLLPDDFK